jgi:glycosyl transferase family 1
VNLANERDAPRLVEGGGDVLLLSMRRLDNLVAFALQYEFEDVIGEVTSADRVEASGLEALERSRRAYKMARYAVGSRRLARALAPRPPTVRLERDYEIFLAIFNHVHELFALAAVPEWRKRSRVAACFINELWARPLPAYLLELLSDFDRVFIATRHAAEEVAPIVGRPCAYLPLATDVLRFAPGATSARPIDVCNIGRRSAITHRALQRLAADRAFFYYYDTVASSGLGRKQRTFRVDDPRDHRLLLASILQRSRYFIANRSRANEPEVTLDRDEISSRFYEGAAAGTVMLGEPPRSDEFERQFDWADAVIAIRFDAADIGSVITELDHDPQRVDRIRRDGIVNAALRHDWVHRLRTIFGACGVPVTVQMREREERLRAVAATAGTLELASREVGVGQPG